MWKAEVHKLLVVPLPILATRINLLCVNASQAAERANLSAAKARMKELAAAYAEALPGLDAHNLMLGLPGVSLKFMPMGDRDGAYDPEHKVILINSEVRPERQRFTLAHEISHAIMLSDDDLLSDLHDAFEGDRLEEVIETLCNVGAAAILMPVSLIQDMIQRFGETGRTLAELARRADVSTSTALYTLAEKTSKPVIYAVCAKMKQTASYESEEVAGLTVRVSASSPSVKYSLGMGTPIPADHPATMAFDTGFEISEASYVPFRSGKRMPAEVVAFPQQGRVVCTSFTLIKKKQESSQ